MSRITSTLAKQLNALLVTGGKSNLINSSGLDSALDRPGNLAHYEKDKNHQPPRLAAEMAWGVIMNHPFQDGNKRTAWTLMVVFLGLNDYRHDFDTDTAFDLVLAVANDAIPLEKSARTLKKHLTSRT